MTTEEPVGCRSPRCLRSPSRRSSDSPAPPANLPAAPGPGATPQLDRRVARPSRDSASPRSTKPRALQWTADGHASAGAQAGRPRPGRSGPDDLAVAFGLWSRIPIRRVAANYGSKRVRRTSLSERLKPFLDDSSANELIYPNKADRPWQYIVLHHSAAPSGNYDQIDAEHRKILGFDGCGYHFVIGNGNGSGDGQIEVAQRWTNQKQGVHCRNARTHDVDEYGIGICLVGDLDKQPPTPRQIAAAKALIAHLSHALHDRQGRVQTHSHLAATKTVCPGKHFPNECDPAP